MAAAALWALAGTASAQLYPPGCGVPSPVRGDYIGDRRQLEIVERFHFTPRVETLIGAQGGGRIGADVDYTLRSFPNHHRALIAMRRLSERQRSDPADGAGTTVECYFRRAIAFREDDTVARMLYADYLIDSGRQSDALVQLRLVESHSENPLTFLNMGQLYFKAKEYPEALRMAHIAMRKGLDRPDLRRSLQEVGQWRDPSPESLLPDASPSSAK